MIADAALPPGLSAPAAPAGTRGVAWAAARWAPEALATLVDRLDAAAPALAELPRDEMFAAWHDVVTRFRDPGSPERAVLDPVLAPLTGLSPAGLAAGLDAVLGGVGGAAADRLFAAAAGRPRGGGLVVVVLASTPPALAVQPLLPALALGRPVLLKSSAAEPLFAPAFVRALATHLPAIGEGVAAVTWRGGDEALEAPVLARAATVVGYGGAAAIASLRARVGDRLIDYGPKMSVALVGRDVDPAAIAPALARDVALFDQRGCLSVQAVLTTGDAAALGSALASALATLSSLWPPGRVDPAAAARVQAERTEGRMRGLPVFGGAVGAGTVVVDPGPLAPSPGLRSVRVHPVADGEAALAALRPWTGLLQGAAVAGGEMEALAPALGGLGISRVAAPGALQSPDALWHNGGRHPLDALANPPGAPPAERAPGC